MWVIFTELFIHRQSSHMVCLRQRSAAISIIQFWTHNLHTFLEVLHIFLVFRYEMVSPFEAYACKRTCWNVYVLKNSHISTKVVVKWNLSWDFGNGSLPESHTMSWCFWESSSFNTEAVNLSLLCSVCLLCNPNSAFQHDGMADLIRRCRWD